MEDKQEAARAAVRAAMIELLTETDEKQATFCVPLRLIQLARAYADLSGVV